MRRLLLMRHAKSDRSGIAAGDFDRPLASRGIVAVPRVARYLVEADIAPDAVFCSPARRARDTLGLVLGILPVRPEVHFDQALYNGGVRQLMAIVQSSRDAHATVMVVGHNPTIQAAAMTFTSGSADAARRDLAGRYPTAALALIDFACARWADVAAGSGTLAAFVTPRSLGGS